MPTFHFEPSARLQRFLGRELLADPNLAIAEFVKNAYDAGATDVYIDFFVAGRPREDQVIRISDNGSGMSVASFERNWMRPGYSYKAKLVVATAAGQRGQRVPAGEKGLGRLAAGRLGETLQVFTRETPAAPWLHVVFDWSDFSDMEKSLAHIPIAYDEDTAPDQPRFRHGTVIEIAELSLNWAGRVRGRKAPGRSDIRIGRLRQDLALLIRPFGPTQTDFRVYLTTDDSNLNQFHGQIPIDAPEFIDYKYEFSVKQVDGRIVITRRLHRSDAIAQQVGAAELAESEEVIGAETAGASTALDSRPAFLRCGDFDGVFYYAPRSERQFRALGVPAGVFLYRDGLRVDPYGHDDDDWLGARARKAARQGYAAVQPNLLTGYVEISKERNPGLVDMSNRQGLVENDAYDDFLAHVRAEFRVFEKLIFEEFVEPNWEQAEDKLQKEAQRVQAYGVASMRALVHSLRQPVAGLGAEMRLLEHYISQFQLPDPLQHDVLESYERAMDHVRAIDQAISRFFDAEPVAQVEPFKLSDALSEAVEQSMPSAKTHGVQVTLADVQDYPVIAPRQSVVEAVKVLICNGIEVARPTGRSVKWVKVRASRQEGNIEIEVSDNGEGIPPAIQNTLFTEAVSRKGRPSAVGLANAKQLLAGRRPSPPRHVSGVGSLWLREQTR